MPTTLNSSGNSSLFKKKSGYHEENQQKQIQTPQSPNYSSNIDVKNLQRTQTGLIRQFKAFVMGVSGGDCAGKKELMGFMFQKIQDKKQDIQKWTWKMAQTGQSVAVLHQSYFYKDSGNGIYSSRGTDWQKFKKKALSLSMGNEIKLILNEKGKPPRKIKILPAKVVCIEGSHIFCQNSLVNDIMNLRVFIDSDSDTRLSRRIYKDTVEGHNLLDLSILKYLTEIKPSYQQEIEPSKVKCDVVVPHFGNGYSDHINQDRRNLDLNIKNVRNLLLSHIRSAMKFYNDEQENELKKENKSVAEQKTEQKLKTEEN